MSLTKVTIKNSKASRTWISAGIIILIVLLLVNLRLKDLIGELKQGRFTSLKQVVSRSDKLKPEYVKRVKLESTCPDEQAGNPDAKLTIKYLYSPVCFWCILEDQHFDELLEKEGQAFKLERYNRENCGDLMQKYNLSLTPGFVFSTKNDPKEYTVDGYISKENLIKIICNVTGYCLRSNEATKSLPTPAGSKVKIDFN